MTRTLFPSGLFKTFQVTRCGPTLLVSLRGDLEDFRYHDVHNDVGRLLDLLFQAEFEGLTIDLQDRLYRGAVLTDALVSFTRAARGKVTLRGVCSEMESRLSELKLTGLLETHAAGRQTAQPTQN